MASAEYKAIEDELSKFVGDVSITILRPTMIFGDLCDHNISKFIRMVDTMPITFEINHGESKLQPVNARDLGRAYYQVIFQLQLPQLYYDVTGERSVTIHELLLLIGSYLGKKVNLISIPLNVGTMGAKLIKIITFGRVNYVERVLRMGEDRDYTHVAAADDFGYYAEPFEKGLKREVDEYLSSINKGIERG